MKKWESSKFSDVCKFVRGPFGGALKKNIFKEKGFAVYEQQHAINNQFTEVRYFVDDLKFEEMRRFELKPQDLIMSCSGTMGKIAIVPEGIQQGIINQALLKLTPNNCINRTFLKLWMESKDFQDQIEELSQGAAIKNMASVKILKEINVPLPPLPEQKRIVFILDQAFADIEKAKANAEQNLKNARELFDSYLQKVFTEKGEGWVEKRLEDICGFQNGFAFKSRDTVDESNTQLIRMGNLYQNILDLNRKPSFYPEIFYEDHERYQLHSGDLIISLTGTVGKEDYGFTVEIPRTGKRLLLNQRIAKFINLDDSVIVKKFLLRILRSREFLDRLYATARGTRQANLSTVTMGGMQVRLPSINRQNELCEIINELEKKILSLESIYTKKIAALDELKKSLLQKAFSGELTKKVSA
jgi:type I restriction enzyme, S subunit